jgi:hypothetical protein
MSNLTELESKEVEMEIIGVDLHAREQTMAMLYREANELNEKTIEHDGE